VPDGHHWLRSIRDMATDIAPQLPAQFDLIGWSMGGYIAFELYPLVQHRVRKAALVHTTAEPESAAARTRRVALLQTLDAQGMAATYTREIPANMADPACLDPDYLAALVAEKLRLGRRAVTHQIEALSARVDARPLLAGWHCQTLVVAGGRDSVAPPQCAAEIATLLGNATLHVFEEAGHCSPWEKTAEFNRLIREFLI
jgi:pimeloyl-ACP methyl ester carboxylesterase